MLFIDFSVCFCTKKTAARLEMKIETKYTHFFEENEEQQRWKKYGNSSESGRMWRQFNFWVNYVEFFYLTCLKLNLLHSFFFSLNLNQALMTSSLKQTERKWRLTRWKVQHCLWKCLLRISSIRHKNVTCPCSPFCSWEMYAVAKIQFFTKNSFAK